MTAPDAIIRRIQRERVALPGRNDGYAADALLVFADWLDQAARHVGHTQARDYEALATGLRNEARAARRDAAAPRPAIPLIEAPDMLRREKGSRA
jgi:hypothetical protein